VARATLSGNMNFFFYKFPLFCDNMDNFVHNAANKTSEFLQYVVVGEEVECKILSAISHTREVVGGDKHEFCIGITKDAKRI
jgi:hypothetical protein